ncbi:MAG: hypothetical protein E6J86_09600 [Deltaproteobacteria bacterium]|nr:MAG: hypothetical protein E6J86_09600 [Deltaproteobacteria bacterium]
MRRLATAAIAGCAALAACTLHRMPGTAELLPDARRGSRGLLQAGAARADVTPPPGPSTFGLGPDSLVTDGYWSRLYCRAFVLETSPQDRVAVVGCDLHSVSGILHRRVAERVRAIVPTSRLFIAATHTHAGPAHYFEAPLYAGAMSTRHPGFDSAMVDFLASRIAGAIEGAFAARRPAAARWVHSTAWQLTRNRSLEAFEANGTLQLFQPPPDLQLSDEEAAIDPSLHVLQLEALDAETRTSMLGPLGFIVLFAMHPNVVTVRNRLFGADTHGAASRFLEAELRRAWSDRCGAVVKGIPDCAHVADLDPLAAVLNTNEGDVSPVLNANTTAEAVRVGRALAERAWETYARDPAVVRAHATRRPSDAGFRSSLVVDSRYLEAYLPGAPLLSPSAAASKASRLCPIAELGAASGHGATDHPVTLDALMERGSDVDARRNDCHAPKKRLLGPLQGLLVGTSPTKYPTHAPFALLRVDDTWLSFVPGEPTVQVGAAINARVLANVRTEDGRPAHAAVVGLANAYFQYLTTRREYAVQAYEGASTLYGPASAEYFEDRFSLLARSMMGESIDTELGRGPRIGEAVAFPYELGPERVRFPRAESSPLLPSLHEPRRQRGLCHLPRPRRMELCFWWSDGAPARVPISNGPWLELVRADNGETVRPCHARPPLDSPWAKACDPGAAIDDRGLDFETRVRGRAGDAWLWSTVLRLSAEEWQSVQAAGDVRLRASSVQGVAPVDSDAFRSSALPPACSENGIRFCLHEAEEERP